MSKMDLQMGTHFGTHFVHLASLCCPRQALGAKMNPKPVQASNFIDFGWILDRFCDDFSCHVGYFFLVCLICFLGYLEAYFTKS